MVRVYKRSNGILYIEYNINGKQVQKSTRLKDTKENRTLIKKEVIPSLERKIILGEITGVKVKELKYYSKIFLREKEYLKAFASLEHKVGVINTFFGTSQVDKINRAMIKDFVHEILKDNSSSSAKNYMSALRGVFNAAIDDEAITQNPMVNIKLPKANPKPITPFTSKEVSTLLTESDGWLRLFLAISLFTGMRTGEVIGLMQSDIDLDRKVISIKRSISKGVMSKPKTDKSIREVPILDGLLPFLATLPKTMYLFTGKDKKPLLGVSGSYQRGWTRLLKKCSISYRKLYTTRHTFIVSMLKNSDLSILEIAQIVGHTSTQMIISNYGKFIKGEHLKIDRKIDIFADINTDITA